MKDFVEVRIKFRLSLGEVRNHRFENGLGQPRFGKAEEMGRLRFRATPWGSALGLGSGTVQGSVKV